MSLSSHFKTNTALERKGVSVELPANEDGTIPTIILARAGRNNPDYQKVVERIFRPFRTAQKLNALPQAKNDELTREAFAEAGTLGWSNMPKADVTGNPEDEGYIDYSKENAIKLFDNLPDLYYSLIEMSVDRQTYLQSEKEHDAKNSVKSSPTA